MGNVTAWWASGEANCFVVPVDFWVMSDEPIVSKEYSCSVFDLYYGGFKMFFVSLDFNLHFHTFCGMSFFILGSVCIGYCDRDFHLLRGQLFLLDQLL